MPLLSQSMTEFRSVTIRWPRFQMLREATRDLKPDQFDTQLRLREAYSRCDKTAAEHPLLRAAFGEKVLPSCRQVRSRFKARELCRRWTCLRIWHNSQIPFPNAPPLATDPFVTLAVPKSHGATELSLATPRGSVENQHWRSTLYNEDLGDQCDFTGRPLVRQSLSGSVVSAPKNVEKSR